MKIIYNLYSIGLNLFIRITYFSDRFHPEPHPSILHVRPIPFQKRKRKKTHTPPTSAICRFHFHTLKKKNATYKIIVRLRCIDFST